MSKSNQTGTAPNSSQVSDPQKRGEDDAAASIPDVDRRRSSGCRTVAVKLRAGIATTTESIVVSPLATEDAAIDLARKQASIPSELFRTGEVLPS